MPKETVKILMGTARSKPELLAKSPLQYLVLSMLAGAYNMVVTIGTSIREFTGRSA
jgi:formate/nitrite transporter FocA (FNT family)